MIKANAFDKKAQILVQYVPGCLTSGPTGGKGGGKKKKKKKGGRTTGGAKGSDGLDPVLTDMRAKVGMGKILSHSLEDVLDLLEQIKKTEVFKNMCIFEPEGDEDPEDDFEIVFPIAKCEIEEYYQLNIIKKLVQDNQLDNFQNLMKACLAVDLAPTDIFQYYYTDTEFNEFFEGFEEKIDIDDILPILNSIVEKINVDLHKLENDVQSVEKVIIQKFDDQRQLQVIHDAIKDYNE